MTSDAKATDPADNTLEDVRHEDLEEILADLRRMVERPLDPDAHLAPVPQEEIDELLAGMTEADEALSIEVTPYASNEVTKSTELVKERASNKVTIPKRGTDARDREIIEEIRRVGIAYNDAGEPASVANFPPLFATTNFEHTGDRLTLAFANEALELLACDETGTRPVSWSLNLSHSRHSEALSHRDGFVGYISGFITRRLEKLLGTVPPLWFIVDFEKRQLQLHGGILVAPVHDANVAVALKYAGGMTDSSNANEHQLHLNIDRCDDGWITYPLRNRATVRAMIGEHYFFVGKKLRREASGLYAHYRAIVKAKDIGSVL